MLTFGLFSYKFYLYPSFSTLKINYFLVSSSCISQGYWIEFNLSFLLSDLQLTFLLTLFTIVENS